MLLRWWKQHLSDEIVGLDLGSETIKLLKINCSELPYRVEKFAIEPLPSGVVFKDGLQDYSTIGSLVADLFKQLNVDTNQVSLAIPRSAVIIKNSTLDKRLTAKEIESRIWIEASRLFPDLVGEIYLDYNPISSLVPDAKQQEYIIVACRKEQLKPYMEVAKQSGLYAKIIDVNCYALQRALNYANKGSERNTVALLNLDLTLSSLILSEHRNLLFAHDQTFDGRRLRLQVQTYMSTESSATPIAPLMPSSPPVSDSETLPNLTFTQPEAPPPATPVKPNPQRATINDSAYINILKENLSVHLRHSMHFLYSSRPAMKIQQMVLSGDLAEIPYLAEFIQQEVGITTVIANPFVNMTISPDVDMAELQQHGPGLMLTCGLALSRSKHLITLDTNAEGGQ